MKERVWAYSPQPDRAQSDWSVGAISQFLSTNFSIFHHPGRVSLVTPFVDQLAYR